MAKKRNGENHDKNNEIVAAKYHRGGKPAKKLVLTA